MAKYIRVLGILEFGFEIGRVLGQEKAFVVWIAMVADNIYNLLCITPQYIFTV
jgi:hypothetical protein